MLAQRRSIAFGAVTMFALAFAGCAVEVEKDGGNVRKVSAPQVYAPECSCPDVYDPVCCDVGGTVITASNQCQCSCAGGTVVPSGCGLDI